MTTKTSMDMVTTTVVAAPTEIKSLTTTSSTIPNSHQPNLFISTTASEVSENLNFFSFINIIFHYNITPTFKVTGGTVLVMMVEQQQQRQRHNSIALVQSQNHQQPFIIPTATTTTSVIDTTTMTSNFQDYYKNEGGCKNGDIVINFESETTNIKQVLIFCILSTYFLYLPSVRTIVQTFIYFLHNNDYICFDDSCVSEDIKTESIRKTTKGNTKATTCF